LPFECAAVYNPCAAIFQNKVYLIYRAEGKYYDRYVSCLCLAESSDGVHFKKSRNNPIIVPNGVTEKRGCEDPRIVKIDGLYYLTYTAFSGNGVGVALAISKDLKVWKKQGIILKGIKSAQILDHPINGEFLMFVGDSNIRIARSKDLKQWKLDKQRFLSPRKRMFDSKLVEVGPQPVALGEKLLFIYNSADKLGVYHPSYCLLDPKNPDKILYRHNLPLASPFEYYELYGKVNYVIFVEGLVRFKNKYRIYYGAADKVVATAELKF
jgi:predicted GH43/DUF377 family glycosyl hydrolase